MEALKRLSTEEAAAYAFMIPEWLLEEAAEADNVEIWGMEDEGVLCGAAVCSREPDAICLKHLYIREEYRGSARGSRFLLELLHDAYEQGVSSCRVNYVPACYPKLERLLKAYPVVFKEVEALGSADCTLKELSELKHLQGSCGQVKALSECTQESLAPLYRRITELGLDFVDFPLKNSEYLTDYSAVAMEKGKPAGLLLVQKRETGVLVPYIVNLSHNVAAPVEMIRFAVQRGSRELADDTRCSFAVANKTLLALLEKLGIKIQKSVCAVLDLNWFEKSDRNVDAYMDVISERSLYV